MNPYAFQAVTAYIAAVASYHKYGNHESLASLAKDALDFGEVFAKEFDSRYPIKLPTPGLGSQPQGGGEDK